jgi:uncharacterized protein YgbK (DUF1537 family)
MVNFIVLADDLTGAIDVGVQFAKKGIATHITLDMDLMFSDAPVETQVLIFDTETRHLSPQEAYARIKTFIERLNKTDLDFCFKKIDSTLRGNIGAEIQALMDCTNQKCMPLLPAYPKGHRFTQQGYQYINDELIENTEFATDPLAPVSSSYIPDVINKQFDVKTQIVSVFNDDMERILEKDPEGILIFDAKTDIELYYAGKLLFINKLLHFSVGTAGFAESLPNILIFKGKKKAIPKKEGPVLLINGSLTNIAFAQIKEAQNSGFMNIQITPDILYADNPDVTGLLEKIQQAKNQNVVISSIQNKSELESYLADGMKISFSKEALYKKASVNLGTIASKILDDKHYSKVIIFGGDTSFHIMNAINVKNINPVDELSPGVSLIQTKGNHEDISFVTKSGGFGDKNLLKQIINMF